MPYEYSFERLQVWKESRALVKKTYVLTSLYPDSEKYGLCSQMRRAAISISSNIAEGTSRNTSKDQKYFYSIAYGSLMELLNQFILSLDLNFISESENDEIKLLIVSIAKKLSGLKRSLNKMTKING